MLTFGSFFSGIGLLDYGLHLAGIEHAWFCEVDPWRREILERRWPGRPVYPDVRGVGASTAVRVDGIVGGFPCKGASTAGKRTGFGHPETVLWREMARAVRELRPRYVVVENVAHILALHGGAVWGEVLGDLATLGYDVVWDCLPAGAVGAPHLRDRVFAVATYADGELRQAGSTDAREERAGRRAPRGGAGAAPDTVCAGLEGRGLCGPATDRTQAAPNARGGGLHEQPLLNGAGAARRVEVLTGGDALGRGVRVEWGSYGPAIRRWEQLRGSAPEPLVRRMDDRGAARVERSRLSALGDGVQVQVGQLVGSYIVERERERLAA